MTLEDVYRGLDFQHWVIDVYRWILTVVTRREEQKGFVVLPKRWHARANFWLV
jgi:transposase